VIAVIVAAVLVVKKRYAWTVYLLITAGGGALLNLELKRYFARARPDIAEMLRRSQGYSFPSGHAMGSTVVFGALSYLVVQTASNWRWKSAVIALTCTLIAAVAFSRVYLGVHWTTDIAAGVTVGVLWLTTTTVAYETLRRIRRLRAPAAS
jgi:undecaprenyl-diphosphatase